MATIVRPPVLAPRISYSFQQVVQSEDYVWQNALLWYLVPAPSVDTLMMAGLY